MKRYYITDKEHRPATAKELKVEADNRSPKPKTVDGHSDSRIIPAASVATREQALLDLARHGQLPKSYKFQNVSNQTKDDAIKDLHNMGLL